MSLPTHSPQPCPPASHPALLRFAALAAPVLSECGLHSGTTDPLPPRLPAMPLVPTLLSPSSIFSPTLHCPPIPHPHHLTPS